MVVARKKAKEEDVDKSIVYSKTRIKLFSCEFLMVLLIITANHNWKNIYKEIQFIVQLLKDKFNIWYLKNISIKPKTIAMKNKLNSAKYRETFKEKQENNRSWY